MPRFAAFFVLLLCPLAIGFAQEAQTDIDKVRQLITAGKYVDAEKLARDMVTKSPTDTEARFQLGRAIFFQDKFQDAIPIFTQVATALPKFAGALKYLGDSYFGLGQYKLAAESYLKAIEIEPKDPEYQTDFARASVRLNSGQAESAFRQALALDPNYIPALFEYGMYLSSQGRFPEAEIQMNKALTLDDKSAYGWSVMGDVLRQQKAYARAEDAYYRALDLDPNRLRAIDGLSRLMMMQELWKDAEEATRRLLEVDSNNLWNYLRMANIIDEQKRYAEAEAIYKKLIADHPKFAEAYVDYGVSLWRQDKDKEAEVQFKAGLTVNPDNAWAHYTFGNFLRQKKRLREAKAAYEAALRINPNYREAKERLDMVNLELG